MVKIEEEHCMLCYGQATQLHHMIRRSKCKALIHCKMNLAPLCTQCHHEVHFGKNSKKLETKLQLVFINKLEMKLLKNEFTKENLKEILEISSNAIDSLSKTMKSVKGVFSRDEVIKACSGGKMIKIEGD